MVTTERDKKRAMDALREAGFSLTEALELLNGPNREAFKQRELRDEFAMAALQGLLSDPTANPVGKSEPAHVAAYAYKCADAMMKVRDA
jgi:hypothetical protein